MPWTVNFLKGPEYETLYALGSMVGIGDLKTIIEANRLCDEYGLDTISMGVSIAFAMDCFEKGFLSDATDRWLAASGLGTAHSCWN